MSIETAIFLGAGASKTEGAPLQGELFRDYFSSASDMARNHSMDEELAVFFRLMFKINVNNPDISTIDFPTFEEVLGLTDLAILRKEAFRDFDIENRAENSGRLRLIAQYLVFLVAKVLDWKLHGHHTTHKKLVDALQAANRLRDVAFVSTNYDILTDNALEELSEVHLDYGLEFRNSRRSRHPNSVLLLKPHGSLNWLFCPTCNELELTPKEKAAVTRGLISHHMQSRCPECQSVYSPLIVSPTFFKDLNNIFLSEIWNRADKMLRRVRHIIFCGYSFPDADIHIKYLLKRAQTNRSARLKFTVINHFPGKLGCECGEEKKRFKRFLGADVNYTTMSFEDFADNPMGIITGS